MVFKVREGMSLVLGLGELLRECREGLELREGPSAAHQRVLPAAVVKIGKVKQNGAVECLGVGRDVRKNLLERGRVRQLSDGETAGQDRSAGPAMLESEVAETPHTRTC